MDKRVIFSVAGSGKTSLIINSLEENTRALIITYTDKNTQNLKDRVLRKFGYIPTGIKIYTYYTFLYSFCFRPILGHKVSSKGISWKLPPLFEKMTTLRHYRDKNKRLYGNRVAKLMIESSSIPEVIERIEKYFDQFYIDEVQDFAGNDFNFLMRLADMSIKQLLVGDFYQHTFDTSRDGKLNGTLHDDYRKYQEKFTRSGFIIDSDTLSHSYRCSSNLCAFVTDQLGVNIQSHRLDETEVLFIECTEHARRLFECSETIKLFFKDSSKYLGYVENWGNVKGQDCYDDVCVVLNPNTYQHFRTASLIKLPPTTKNKLYVACTRAKRNLYFIDEAMYKNYRQ